MKKRNAETKEKQLERFLMNVAETAENALREYRQEREAKNRLYAAEYVTRQGFSRSSNNIETDRTGEATLPLRSFAAATPLCTYRKRQKARAIWHFLIPQEAFCRHLLSHSNC